MIMRSYAELNENLTNKKTTKKANNQTKIQSKKLRPAIGWTKAVAWVVRATTQGMMKKKQAQKQNKLSGKRTHTHTHTHANLKQTNLNRQQMPQLTNLNKLKQTNKQTNQQTNKQTN